MLLGLDGYNTCTFADHFFSLGLLVVSLSCHIQSDCNKFFSLNSINLLKPAVMATAPASNPDFSSPKSMKRAKKWSDEVEEVYRFQLAGYRDRHDYAAKMGEIGVGNYSTLYSVIDVVTVEHNPKLHDTCTY